MNVEIIPDEQRKEILHLFVGEDFSCEIHTAIFGRHPRFSFYEGSVSEQFFQKEFERSRLFVLKRLSQRSYSSFELRDRLKDRLVSEETIERVIEDCVHLGYLDDKAWLEQFIRTQMLHKTGPKVIEAKLYQKGVPKSFYEPILASLVTYEDQKTAIGRLIQTRFRTKDLNDFRERQKVFGALVRKGYDFEIVKEMFNQEI